MKRYIFLLVITFLISGCSSTPIKYQRGQEEQFLKAVDTSSIDKKDKIKIIYMFKSAGVPDEVQGKTIDQTVDFVRNYFSVTSSKYEAVKIRMTYKQVKNIMHWDGQEISRNEMEMPYGGKLVTVVYVWANDHFKPGSNMNVMFQNGKVFSKAQFGL